eukprot:SAG31_NODE_3764_length_3904_cov_1.346386_3_plen_155_part_00
MAGTLKPDVLIAVDVNHDYEAAPIGKEEKHCPLELGKGMTLCVGAVASAQLGHMIERAAGRVGLPVQRDVRGRDTGTDAMAAVLASVDTAATSVGFPIRNMHTISELAHTADVLGCITVLHKLLVDMDKDEVTAACFKSTHPRLDEACMRPESR